VYVLRGLFAGFWNGSNLGLPSSHAAVAAGGAAALIAWRPAVWPIAVVLAAGCAMTRLLSGAHFLSDVTLGAIVGYVAWRLVRPGGWRGRAERGSVLLP
jgi:membrane-associated phospholipid phosphatase